MSRRRCARCGWRCWEADAALPAVRALLDAVKEQAVGQDVLRSVTPGQQVVKIVHDRMVEMLGGEAEDLRLGGNPPLAMLMLGLQGSGKTTTTAKLARRLTDRDGKKVLMASVDIYRPAAQQQLQVLGKQAGIDTLPIVFGERPPAIARRAMRIAAREGYDIVFIDTAGRLAIDREMMEEAAAAARSGEAGRIAAGRRCDDGPGRRQHRPGLQRGGRRHRHRADPDRRRCARRRGALHAPCHGAADQVRRHRRAAGPHRGLPTPTGSRPAFSAMGDVVGLVERAAETIEQEEAEKLAARLSRGRMDLNDLLTQLRQMKKMGGLGGLMGMLPQVGRMKAEMAKARIDEKMARAPGGDHPFDDAPRARPAGYRQGVAQAAHRRRGRRLGAGS